MRALHPLARNRAGDQHDLAVDARDHPAAGGRLLDRERDDLPAVTWLVGGRPGRPGSEQSAAAYTNDDRRQRERSRTSRSIAACARAGERSRRSSARESRPAPRRPRARATRRSCRQRRRAPPEQLRVEADEPIEQRVPRASPRRPPRRRARVELARQPDRAARRRRGRACPCARAFVRRSTTRSRCAGSDGRRGRSPASAPGLSTVRAADRCRVRPTARRHSSNTSSTSASQKSIRTGRRRGPLR